MKSKYVIDFGEPDSDDVALVGGKNASLGRVIMNLEPGGIRVPQGFAVTVAGFHAFLAANHMEAPIASHLSDLAAGTASLSEASGRIRDLFLAGEFPRELAAEIRESYRRLGLASGRDDVAVAVRSSATAEDLPGASFAGQQETFLNVVGAEDVIDACRRCFASLYTERGIAYREEKGFLHEDVGLSVGVQRMVRSDKGASGVMFSIDMETGFPRVVVIDATLGLGESIAQGTVMPDQFVVFKPLLGYPRLTPILDKSLGSKETKVVYASTGTQTVATGAEERNHFVLSDEEILLLARWAVTIEAHYGMPMDMEWAKDGDSGEIFLVQARPETVHSRAEGMPRDYHLKAEGKRLLAGLSIGQAIASGPVCVIKDAVDIGRFRPGSVLVTGSTSPDWVPIMKQAAAIITDAGGRTSHAAIVSRELEIPAVVGTGNGTSVLQDGQQVTVSCAEGELGFVYEGAVPFESSVSHLPLVSPTRTQVMINLADPASAFRWWRLPVRGVGLARMEFIISNLIKIHPMALLRFDELEDAGARDYIVEATAGYKDRAEFFVDRMSRGLARIAASQYPYPVIVRMSDFKSNEYANLVGGAQFEPAEENPMLGFRGASRYYSHRYRDGFALECKAVRRVREAIGLSNVIVMVPFCRTPEEADLVLEVMAENGLERGRNGLQVYVMAEIPSNVILAEEFARRFDGFSIGSNDLTQLVLGIDRDAADLAHLYDERNGAVKAMMAQLIASAHRVGAKVGICGQAPSDYPELAEWLASIGIDSISANPDSVAAVSERIARAETAWSREHGLVMSGARPPKTVAVASRSG